MIPFSADESSNLQRFLPVTTTSSRPGGIGVSGRRRRGGSGEIEAESGSFPDTDSLDLEKNDSEPLRPRSQAPLPFEFQESESRGKNPFDRSETDPAFVASVYRQNGGGVEGTGTFFLGSSLDITG